MAVKGRRERRLDFTTCGGIPRDARVVWGSFAGVGLLFPGESDCDWGMLLLPGSVSGVVETVIDVEGLCGLEAGLLAPEIGSRLLLRGIIWERLSLPGVSSQPSPLALSRVLARVSCSCFAASLGSDVLGIISNAD